MAKTTGCFTIVLNEKGQILLTKRKDFPIWDLPGGRWEKGETLEDCAIRETEEETGYNIQIKRKIGEYFQPQFDDMQFLFMGELKGGIPIEEGPETAKVEWFSSQNLPFHMVHNRRKQIKNFLKNKNRIVKQSITVSPIQITLLKSYLKVFWPLLR
ncbi:MULTISPECIES: NUDIX hydrolase [Bacillaceae]|jgi:8-oxo-dGTP diphosphatase|uniref:NUDIX hydrolase n=1 Tax=Bacillaceae TaxID=186817 RepID=UPI0004E16D8F|nr:MULTISPECIES: NUDIX hydrolase [Bacillaceae]MCF2650490.1 NUDIX hydrolase [Niallia circulans]CAI9391530.1 RNA pyrophosphohydrolase [Bacillus sp. T2.9-1]